MAGLVGAPADRGTNRVTQKHRPPTASDYQRSPRDYTYPTLVSGPITRLTSVDAAALTNAMGHKDVAESLDTHTYLWPGNKEPARAAIEADVRARVARRTAWSSRDPDARTGP